MFANIKTTGVNQFDTLVLYKDVVVKDDHGSFYRFAKKEKRDVSEFVI